MPYVMVDVETDGPIPGDYSMIEIGAVVVEIGLTRTFYGRLRPISDKWDPTALSISVRSRTDTLEFDDPKEVMQRFAEWLPPNPKFVSDNNGFDWQFVNWYFHHFLGNNPFGHSSIIYKGLMKNTSASFKTAHTHHPVDDAIGNAEAMLQMLPYRTTRLRPMSPQRFAELSKDIPDYDGPDLDDVRAKLQAARDRLSDIYDIPTDKEDPWTA